MIVHTYEVEGIHISVQHADTLQELEVGMGFGRVQVEYIVESIVVELA